jgi:hypothetical protein
MTDADQPGNDHQGHQGHQTDAAAHPEQAIDELEEQVLGRQMDQIRNEDDATNPAFEQDRDEQGPGAEPP